MREAAHIFIAVVCFAIAPTLPWYYAVMFVVGALVIIREVRDGYPSDEYPNDKEQDQ